MIWLQSCRYMMVWLIKLNKFLIALQVGMMWGLKFRAKICYSKEYPFKEKICFNFF